MRNSPHIRANKIDRLFAPIIAITLWLPGIAIFSVAKFGVQPLYLALIGYAAMDFSRSRGRLRVGSLLIPLITVASLVVSTMFHPTQKALGLMGFSAMQMLLVYYFTQRVRYTQGDPSIFMRWFLHAGVAMSIFGILDALYSAYTHSFYVVANNPNFALLYQFGRVRGLMPEASIMIIYIMSALCLVVFLDRKTLGIGRLYWAFCLVLLAAAAIGTRSSGLPILASAMIVILFLRAIMSGRIVVPILVALLLPIGFTGYSALYQQRNLDAGAQTSISYRGEKMLTGFDIFRDHPLIGAGLGFVSDPTLFSAYDRQRVRTVLLDERDQRKGIDSVPVRVLAEQGILGALAFLLLWAFALAGVLKVPPSYRAAGIGTLAMLLIGETVSTGYRDLPVFLLFPLFYSEWGAMLTPVRRNRAHQLKRAPTL